MDTSRPHSKKALERFVFFSDAVFAFALTLLAVELRLPPHTEPFTSATLALALRASAPMFFAFVLSFLVVASLWMRHHRMFEKVTDYDTRLVTLNFALLFSITVIPFSVELVTESRGSPLSQALMGVALVLPSLAELAIFRRLQKIPGLHAEPVTGPSLVLETVRAASLPIFLTVLCAAEWLAWGHHVLASPMAVALGVSGLGLLAWQAERRAARAQSSRPEAPSALME